MGLNLDIEHLSDGLIIAQTFRNRIRRIHNQTNYGGFMFNLKTTLIIAFIAVLFLSVSAYSIDQETKETLQSTFPKPRRAYTPNETKAHIGAELGYAEPGQNFDAGAEYGINVGFQPVIPFGLGAELTTFRASEDTGIGLQRTKLMINGTYNFGGPIAVLKNSYVGTGVGSVFDAMGGQHNVYLGINLLGGMDFPIAQDGIGRNTFTIGGAAKYLIIPEPDVQDSFALNAQIKYWY